MDSTPSATFYNRTYKIDNHICLLQEGFRSQKKEIEHHFQYLYTHYWSETGRTGILCRRDFHSTCRYFSCQENQFQLHGYESCWVEVSISTQTKPILFCSFYRNIRKTS